MIFLAILWHGFLFIAGIQAAAHNENNLKAIHDELLDRSEAFQLLEYGGKPYPSKYNLISYLGPRFGSGRHNFKAPFADEAKSIKILIHRDSLELMEEILAIKKEEGTRHEKQIYANMNIDDFINRLVRTRVLTCHEYMDETCFYNHLTNKVEPCSPRLEEWKRVGTLQEVPPFDMNTKLTYDEQALAALILFASKTTFINNCARSNGVNQAIPASKSIKSGYAVGMVGARLQNASLLESKYMLHFLEGPVNSSFQGFKDGKIGEAWLKFYGLSVIPYIPNGSTIPVGYIDGLANVGSPRRVRVALNKAIYMKRIRVVLEPLILYANSLPLDGKRPLIRITGVGTGQWSVNSGAQGDVFIETVMKIIQDNSLYHNPVVEFIHLPTDSDFAANFSTADKMGRQIEIKKSNINMADPIDPNLVLIATYPLIANALPGNEYYLGSQYVNYSMSPAMASCSSILEIHNPFINMFMNSTQALMVVPPRDPIESPPMSAVISHSSSNSPRSVLSLAATPQPIASRASASSAIPSSVPTSSSNTQRRAWPVVTGMETSSRPPLAASSSIPSPSPAQGSSSIRAPIASSSLAQAPLSTRAPTASVSSSSSASLATPYSSSLSPPAIISPQLANGPVQCSTKGHLNFNDLVHNSEIFRQEWLHGSDYPVQDNLIQTLVQNQSAKHSRIAHQAMNVKILVHPRSLHLMEHYLAHKQVNGNSIEKAVYQGMDLNGFIDRLIQKRPLAFFTQFDNVVLKGGRFVNNQNQAWKKIGTPAEFGELVMKNYLSYQEIELAALIGVAVPTYFINNGSRDNRGIPGQSGSYQTEGVIVALVGARFENPGVMESKYFLGSSNNLAWNFPGYNNTHEALLWKDFYGLPAPLTTESIALSHQHFVPASRNRFLHVPSLDMRMRVILEPLFEYADWIAEEREKKAVVQIVGFGAGCWAVNQDFQKHHIIATSQKILESGSYPNIAVVEFIYMGQNGMSWAVTSKDGNQIQLTSLYVNELLRPVQPGQLLVNTYAWDGNAFPGNEYWAGMLDASGDPAAAACSTISQLQNPFINTCLRASKALWVPPK